MDDGSANSNRRAWMNQVAKAAPARLATLLDGCAPLPAHEFLRRPEIGAVMARGRTGGTGAPFNLGEMTVTRCTIRLATGEVGHAWVQGRNKGHAEHAALVDALMQGPRADEIRTHVLTPLAREHEDAQADRAAKAAATKVEFFTMVRGED